MMKKYIVLIIVAVAGFGFMPIKAQYALKEGDGHFELFNYEKAVKSYTNAYQRKKTIYAAQKLGECYRLMRDFRQAASWYGIAVNMEGAKPETFKLYADMLRNNSKYSEAKVQYLKYAALTKGETTVHPVQIANWIKSCDSAVVWTNNPKQVSIINERALNSPQFDWAPVVYQGGLIFTSDRKINSANAAKPFLKLDGAKLPNSKIYGWTGNNYLRLYQKSALSDSVLLMPVLVHSAFHVGSTTFSKDEKEVYFTLTRIPEKIEKTKGSPSTINIEIYSSRKNGDTWTEPIPFRYNNIQKWSVGDPFLTDDGSELYFVANMPGGKGGTDIYVSKRNSDGSWRDAVNLEAVNTVGNERSPVLQNGILYFSSDEGIGMGGLDIFKVKIVPGGIGRIENLGYPFNSPQDDFTFRPNGNLKGYFASNREGGMGQDDIYSFVEQLEMKLLVQGKVFNQETNQPLVNAVVTLKKHSGETLTFQTGHDGSYKFALDENTNYELIAGKTHFRTAFLKFSTQGLKSDQPLNKELYLIPIVENKPIRIENIYYDFNQSNIRMDATVELDKLIVIMKENPTIWIELGSHTDSRGNDQYNQRLSQSRANSAVQYIIDRGVEKTRITAKGYGENVPINKCKNGIKCNEMEHQLNRRTEFKIVKQ